MYDHRPIGFYSIVPGSAVNRTERQKDTSMNAVLESPGDSVTGALKNCYYKGNL